MTKAVTKKLLEKDSNITAKVIADSVTGTGKRITTFELEFNRYILCELLTHSAFARNSSSSRAIPINKMIGYTENNMAMPLYYGAKARGMQASGEIDDKVGAEFLWTLAYDSSKSIVQQLDKKGMHKQIPNRLLEPFQMIKIVLTATEFDNFFHLRIHGDAMPEIAQLSYKMYKARTASAPTVKCAGEWHLPYVDTVFENGKLHYYTDDGRDVQEEMELEEAIKYSAAMCAAVSYRTEVMTKEKAVEIYDNKLYNVEILHGSPMEHQAKAPLKSVTDSVKDWEDGFTHMNRRGELCSGQMVGWIQHRHLIPNNTNWGFDFDKRMEELSSE